MIDEKIKIINIETRPTEASGDLAFFEGDRDIPFSIKRIYYIYGTPKGTVRGGHAHKQLKQLLVCMHGKVKVILDDGREKREVLLETPNTGICLEAGLWRDIEYLEDDSLLFVAASEYYDENDYIRDYDKFMQYVKEK